MGKTQRTPAEEKVYGSLMTYGESSAFQISMRNDISIRHAREVATRLVKKNMAKIFHGRHEQVYCAVKNGKVFGKYEYIKGTLRPTKKRTPWKNPRSEGDDCNV